jgi:hypothetical protein
MKDVVLLAGGNSERGLLLRDKLAAEQYCAKFCHSFTDVCSTISQATKNNMARSLRYQANEFLIEPISIDEIAKIIDDSIDSRLRNDNNNVLMIGDLVLNK